MGRDKPGGQGRDPFSDKRPESTTEEELDEALEETFPASDPPAPVSRGTIRHPNPEEREERESHDRRA
jgi:hypothetical protein